ncbi:hypothetical protein [Novosphingobium sp. LASN5T]|uniref:hypothetical protein n=1 Tax=Novosphingobium sp. LASN5T TaxID=2491021 RepID=UPI000F5EBAC9|nr:hypothetical protein [Novosphingobium sp. LASN5T]RQW42851.1 hypothetical protein EH199_16015 [Novosphingobium sp. LASN5T]
MTDEPKDARKHQDQHTDQDEQSHPIVVHNHAGEAEVTGAGRARVRPRNAPLVAEDTPDTVDRMNEMLRSGRLDYTAYEGEPAHDDEEDRFGLRDD